MKLLKTTVVSTDAGFIVEMSFGNPDDDQEPYLAFRVSVEPHPEGRLPLEELQQAALSHVLDELREQKSRLSAT